MAFNERRNEKEVQALKDRWFASPFFDIEKVPGFEAHANELRQFAHEHGEHVLEVKAEIHGIPGNKALAKYILDLEWRVEILESAIEGPMRFSR